MEKITKEVILNFVAENAIALKSKQPKLCVPIIDRLYKKMLAGIKFTDIGVDNELICDGHHRYLASLLARYPIGIQPARRTSADTPKDWNSVEYEEMDWDTQAKIKMLNDQDALYNNIPREEIIQLLK